MERIKMFMLIVLDIMAAIIFIALVTIFIKPSDIHRNSTSGLDSIDNIDSMDGEYMVFNHGIGVKYLKDTVGVQFDTEDREKILGEIKSEYTDSQVIYSEDNYVQIYIYIPQYNIDKLRSIKNIVLVSEDLSIKLVN